MFSAANTVLGIIQSMGKITLENKKDSQPSFHPVSSIKERMLEKKIELQSCSHRLVSPHNDIIAITGATGYIGSHIAVLLLQLGFTVRAGVRSPDNKEKTKHFQDIANKHDGHIDFFYADLMKPGSYDKAFEGASVVIHCAAVATNKYHVKDPKLEIVDPSVKGSHNVYKSIQKVKSVKRVIHTSSVAAIQDYDHDPNYIFTEKDYNEWSSMDNEDYYGLAKTQAEKIALSYGKRGHYDVVVINPYVALGPCLTKAHTKTTPFMVRDFMYGNVQIQTAFTIVDVRDVAEAHIQAMLRPEASGRYIISGDYETHYFTTISLGERCQKLRPDIMFGINMRGGLLYDLYWYTILPEFEKKVLSSNIKVSNTRSKQELGMTYRNADDTIRDTIESMISGGFMKPKLVFGSKEKRKS